MPLLKTRPDIGLYAPTFITPGRPFRVRVVLRCPESIPVDEVLVELIGSGVWYTSSQYGRHRHELPFARFVATPVEGRRELGTGEHEFLVSFEVPRDLPPTWGGRLSIEWKYRIHVDIPWWPDAKATFMAAVQPGERLSEAPTSRVFASSTEGPRDRKPYAEVSLGPLRAGEILEGKIALTNTAANDYHGLKFALMASETGPGLLSPWTQHTPMAKYAVDLDNPGENEPIDFRLRLPGSLMPAFRTQTLELKWALEIRLDIAWALDPVLWIPVDVEPAVRSGVAAEEAAPLAVGTDRLAQVWSVAGRRAGFNYRDGELACEIGVGRLVVRRQHRGRRGLRLLAEASFADLDLGLREEGGRLRCRDPRQSQMLADRLDPLFAQLGLIEADDERFVCMLDDPGTRTEPVAEAAEDLAASWRAFEALLDELPAPTDMENLVPAFRRAARRLGGDFFAASMDIRGARAEMPFSFEVQWGQDGVVARTVLTVEPALPVDGRWHQRWDGVGEPAQTPDGLADLLSGATGLVIDATSIRIAFPPCDDDPGPLVERLEGLLEVGRRLGGHGIGYR